MGMWVGYGLVVGWCHGWPWGCHGWPWGWSWVGHGSVMVGHGRPWVRVCVCGACAPPTPTNTILLYLHDTHQTSPQLFPLNAAGPLKLARPSAHSRASMPADEATGPSASTPGARSFYSDFELVGRDGTTIGHASTPGASTPGDSTPGALPPPPAPWPVGASTPGASTPGASRDDPPQRRARQDWRPRSSPTPCPAGLEA